MTNRFKNISVVNYTMFFLQIEKENNLSIILTCKENFKDCVSYFVHQTPLVSFNSFFLTTQ